MATNSKSAARNSIPPVSTSGIDAQVIAQDTRLLNWVRTNRERIISSLLFYASKSGGGEMGEYHTLATQFRTMTETGGTATMAATAGGSSG
jgi:hypothetical protein